MGDMDKKLLEKLNEDFHKISSKEGWEPCDVTLMKDLQKLMYYIEVRDAMKGNGEYPGSEYIDERRRGYGDYGMSYRRGRDDMGRFTSGDMGYGNRGYGHDGPWYYDSGYDQGSGRRYYDDMRGASGRRYYDSEKDNALTYLHRMMDSESRPEVKNMMQSVARELEGK